MLRARFSGLRLAVVAGLVCSLSAAAIVQAAPSVAAAIKARQDKLRDMGGAFKAIDDELKKGKPDWDNIILTNAETVKARSSYLLTWFPAGTGPESGAKTYALPIIWKQMDDFNKLGKTAIAEAAKLQQVAAAKDGGALKVQYVVLGKACKACHDTYRSPDYEKEND